MNSDVVNEASAIAGTHSLIFFISRCWCYRTVTSNWAQMVISVYHKSSEGNRHLNSRPQSPLSVSFLFWLSNSMSLNSFPVTCNLHIQKGNPSCAPHRPGSKWKMISPGWTTDLCSPTSGSALGLSYIEPLALWAQLASSCLEIRPQTDSYGRCSITAMYIFFFFSHCPHQLPRCILQCRLAEIRKYF